jgi:molybdate transport system regulatory protein
MKTSVSGQSAAIIRPRIHLGEHLAIGPGKIDLLRAVGQARSISAAAKAMGMTYKRAWLLIDTLNRGFGRPVVEATTGGKGGGGARLTPLGEALVQRYAALETRINAAAGAELAALRSLTE